LFVGIGQRVQVTLCCRQLRVTHTLHHGLEVGATREYRRGVGMSKIMNAHVKGETGARQCRQPDLGAEGVARERARPRLQTGLPQMMSTRVS